MLVPKFVAVFSALGQNFPRFDGSSSTEIFGISLRAPNFRLWGTQSSMMTLFEKIKNRWTKGRPFSKFYWIFDQKLKEQRRVLTF